MHPAFARTDHRPWQLPARDWSWRQSWLDLLFVHWPVPKAALRHLVPSELEIQEFDGTSWIGLVPFRMEGVMRRPLPDLPWISAFPELNVRIYVEHAGKAGVWFLSLDATNPLAVWAARRYFHLPYHRAWMEIQSSGDDFRYKSRRAGAEPSLELTYRPSSTIYASKPGTLEHWLTERYCLYAQAPDGSIWSNDVHHVPWPLQAADAEIAHNSYFASHGLTIEGPPPVLHFSRRIDAIVWNASRIA